MSSQYDTESIDDASAAFDLLRNPRRRGVLYALRRDGRTSVEELARRIAAWRAGEYDAASPETVEVSLVHSHLPKLAAANVVQYDRERDAVELADCGAELGPLLRRTSEREPDLFRAARASNLGALDRGR